MPRYGIKLASHFLEVPRVLELARYAESLGYHSVWTTEIGDGLLLNVGVQPPYEASRADDILIR